MQWLIFINIYHAAGIIDAAQAAVVSEPKSQEEAYQKITQKLSKERIENIVIINDQEEFFSDFFDGMLMTKKLIFALIDEQTILCSKAIFKNMQRCSVFFQDLFRGCPR
jgi:hypothetical protein